MKLGDFLGACSAWTPVQVRSCVDAKIIFDGMAGQAMCSHWDNDYLFYNIYQIEWTLGKKGKRFLTVWIFKEQKD